MILRYVDRPSNFLYSLIQVIRFKIVSYLQIFLTCVRILYLFILNEIDTYVILHILDY